MIKVFGHKSPDTDATCSAIAFAWYLNKTGKKARAFINGSLNKETLFVLKKFAFNTPDGLEKLSVGDDIVIVDTNNPEELPDNINEANILEIIDHHKLFGGLVTSSPIQVTMKPVACTATLIYQRMQSEGIKPDAQIAGIMLSAILSDTLKFTSPTTTQEDKKAAQELEEIAQVKMDSLVEEMFAAKSDLSGLAAKEILYMDSKVFEFGNKKVRISSLETTKPENAKALISEIKREMQNAKNTEGLDYIFFFIVDIMNTSSELVVASDEEYKVAKEAFGEEFKDEYIKLPGVVSRKKQMAPAIEKVLT